MEEVVIREYDAEKDCEWVELLEKRCEVGPSRKASLLTDLMGDPICRIRHAPAFIMLVKIPLLPVEFAASNFLVSVCRPSFLLAILSETLSPRVPPTLHIAISFLSE